MELPPSTLALDLTTEEVDFDELADLFETFQDDDRVKQALQQGVDMREYTKSVENELREAELESVVDYIKESENINILHSHIQSCDDILAKMETMLTGFQADLGDISDEIKVLQEQSTSMSVQLNNRKAVGEHLGKFLDEVAVTPSFIRNICEGEMNEAYVEYLTTLHKKLEHSAKQPDSVACMKDVQPELQKLRLKAVSKVREVLLSKIYLLRRKATNVQVIQQNQLFKYRSLMSFLRQHGREVYQEIQKVYVDTLSRIVYELFMAYSKGLMKFKKDIATRDDQLGAPEHSGKSGFFGDRFARERSNVYCLGNRYSVLYELETPKLALADIGKDQRFPYEAIFRSLCDQLMKCIAFECSFDSDFFGPSTDLFSVIFGRSVLALQDNLHSYLGTCWDAIGVFILVKCIEHYQKVMAKHKISKLNGFFDRSLQLFWARLNMILSSHTESLKAATSETLGSLNIRPHYVTRRYAEFSSALLTIKGKSEDGREPPALRKSLDALRSQMEALLTRLARDLPTTENTKRVIFLINNYDQILNVMRERDIESEETARFETLMSQQIDQFVEFEINKYFGDLNNFVEANHPKFTQEEPVPRLDVETVRQLVRNFSSTWKSTSSSRGTIESIEADTKMYFSNLCTGELILREALSKLADLYSKFSMMIKKSKLQSSLSKDFIPLPTLTHTLTLTAKRYMDNV